MRKSLTLALSVLVVAGCSVGPYPSASTTTSMPAAEHWFKVSWNVEPDRDTSRRVTGYVSNEYGSPMADVQLLAQALDPSNAVVGQKLAWVPGVMSPFSRSYFEIGGLPVADHYRVTVWSFDVIQSPGPIDR